MLPFRRKPVDWKHLFPLSWRDFAVAAAIFSAAIGICTLLRIVDDGDIYVSMIFLLAVLLIARATNGYFFGLVAAFISVFCINLIFTYPYWHFNFSISGYPLTFFSMMVVSLVTSTLTTQAKEREKLRLAAEREKLRGNLLRSVSHDLRTPLTAILGSAGVLLEDEQLPPQFRREMLQGIQDDVSWLIRIVENLLSITRIGGAADINKQPEAAEEIVGAAYAKFHRQFPNVPVDITIPEDVLMVPMDAMLIQQVLMNLLENAVRHGKTVTTIRLILERQDNRAVFSIIDNGCGILPELLPHIFEGISTSGPDASRGMGIGLSVCMSIIKAHGGTMNAANNPDGGARFTFMLPL